MGDEKKADASKSAVKKVLEGKGGEAEAKVIVGKNLEEETYDGVKVGKIVESKDLGISRIREIGNDVATEYDRKRDVAYYVLEGEAECVVNGAKRTLKKGDCVFYPKGSKPKRLRGAILLEISSPPLDRSKRFYSEGSTKQGRWSLVLFAIAIILRLTAMYPLSFLNKIYELSPYLLILPQVFLPPALYIAGLILAILQLKNRKTMIAYIGIALNIIGLILSFFYFSVVCGPNQDCVVWFLKMFAALIV